MQLNNSIVCTLFEGHYHYGVAALVNSLYKNDFRGHIYAGYKGNLPGWAKDATENASLNWSGASSLEVVKGLHMHFLPVTAALHLANYKPGFMLALKKFTGKGIVYFDPDIAVRCRWEFFEEWIQFGVAMVQEIVSNVFPAGHPRRMQYKAVIEKSGKRTERSLNHVFNSGFCGVSIMHLEFVETWQKIINTSVEYFGYNQDYFIKTSGQTSMFSAGDQDTFNMAATCCTSPISDMGPEGMDFIPGGWLMSHATGSPKPWNKIFLLSSIKGFPPSLADKAYWFNSQGLIKTHSNAYIKFKRAAIFFSSFIGRFYKRS